MKLGFDLDGIINDLRKHMVEYIEQKYGVRAKDDSFDDYWISNAAFTEDLELNKTISDDLSVIINDMDFLTASEPYEEVPRIINGFRKAGHSIHILTNRGSGKSNEEKTALWLRKHGVVFDTLNHCGINGKKGILGRALNLDFFLDDHESNLESLYLYKNRWRKGLGLFTRPWNRKSIDGSKFIRFDNWDEVKRHLGIHKKITHTVRGGGKLWLK